MMSKDKRLFIDVTQLISWQGKLTGVPRVMTELSVRFQKQGNCVFMAWDNDHKVFVPVNLLKALQDREVDSLPQNASDVTNSESALLEAARRFKNNSAVLNKLLTPPVKAARKLRKPVSAEPADVTKLNPGAGDSVLVLWGAWDNVDYINCLIEFNSKGVSLLQIAYDMLPIVTPQYSGHSTESLKQYSTQIYPLCKTIFAISKNTKKDVGAWLKQNELNVPKIEVIRLGDDFQLSKPAKPSDDAYKKSGLSGKDYIVCVGTIEARKNHTVLYYAYKLAFQNNQKLPKIVIVGRRGWKTDDILELISEDPQTKDQFIFLQNTSDEELSWLYQNSLFSIYPSFYEGWGLPIAESIRYGVPCLCSNTSSMTEIAGDLVDYFSPSSSDELLQRIIKLLDPKVLAQTKSKLSSYKTTSWDETFQEVVSIIGETNA